MSKQLMRRLLARRRLQAAAQVANNQYLPMASEHVAYLDTTPEKFLHDSFASEAEADGVRCVKGKLKAGEGDENNALIAASYCFDGSKFSADDAQAWLRSKNITPAKFEPSKDSTYRQITAAAPRTLNIPQTAAVIRAESGKLPSIQIRAYSGGVSESRWISFSSCY